MVLRKPPIISLGIISASALAYEILLMRLFSIIQWHHFAYMIISLALLGYGISGTLVSLSQKILKQGFYIAYPLLLLLFSISSFSCFLLAQSIPFNPEAILWEQQQFWYLVSIFLLLSLPFMFAASAICLLFIQYPKQIGKIYAIDLIGAGIGSIGIIIILFYVFPNTALVLISLSGLIASSIAIIEIQQLTFNQHRDNKHIFGYYIFALIIIVLLVNASLSWQLKISSYKDLSKIQNISGTQIIEQQSSPLGLLSIVESQKIPFRYAPGLSLYNSQEPSEQLGLFSDASNMTAITRYPDHINKLTYLDQVTSALPYHLNGIQRLLIVGGGGGSDILQALFHKTKWIDVLELNPQIINFLSEKYARYSGFLYAQDTIKVYAEDVRGFLSKQKQDDTTAYDLIQISLIDSFNASASGLYALHASYLYTVEALHSYFQHLNPDGYLAISRWIKTPPRDSIKIFSTAIKALEKQQIPKQIIPEHLVLIRAWQTSTLLVKKNPFTQLEINNIKQFCQARAFDVVWYPGIKASEVNKFNRFRQPWLYQAANSLLSDPEKKFIKEYKYYIYPATDDKPFFHHFFKWSGFKELLSLANQGGLALVEMGYIVLITTLILAIFSSFILILLPLIVFYFRSKNTVAFSLPVIERIRLFIYFFAIGLAFLFIEIAMMQKFILFLYHPIYALPVVLTAFMIFAGVGSALTNYLLAYYSPKQVLRNAVIAIVVLGLFYSYFLNYFFVMMVTYSLGIKITVSFICIAPLAICMGIPFPLGLSTLSFLNNSFIPWAWGINGCASVISAVLASLLAIHYGFSWIILFALAMYILCLLVYKPREQGRDNLTGLG